MQDICRYIHIHMYIHTISELGLLAPSMKCPMCAFNYNPIVHRVYTRARQGIPTYIDGKVVVGWPAELCGFII